jgi:hypothetical protein
VASNRWTVKDRYGGRTSLGEDGLIYWRFSNPEVRSAGALPPVPLDLPYGRRSGSEKPRRGIDLQRGFVAGRPVIPSDCPPIRVISSYGFAVRTPGLVRVERNPTLLRWREYDDDSSGYGWCRVSGDRWPEGDSGYVASWISGSEFVKIQVGITVLYPTRFLLYQGPLPNLPLIDAPEPLSSIMAGLDYPRTDASELIGEQPHSRAVLNVIMRIPRQPDRPVEISAGQPLAWFMLVPKKQRMLAL